MGVSVQPRSPEKIILYGLDGCGVSFSRMRARGKENRIKQEPNMCPALPSVNVIPFLRENCSCSSKPQGKLRVVALGHAAVHRV